MRERGIFGKKGVTFLNCVKGCLSLFHHSIDMRTALGLSISCRKNLFLLKFSNKNSFFPHEMDKLTVVLTSIKRLNKERQPLVKVERIEEDSLDSIPSPSPSVKIQIIGGKVYLR
jgi:hypothetical protein